MVKFKGGFFSKKSGKSRPAIRHPVGSSGVSERYQKPAPDCINLRLKFENVVGLKSKFDYFFNSRELNEAYEIKKELKLKLEDLEDLVGLRLMAEVDYSIPIKDMIELRKYNNPNPDINDKHFPQEYNPKTKITFRLLSIPVGTKTEDILQQMKDRGLRPATLQELLAFEEKYPHEQLGVSIAALGSRWLRAENDLCVPAISGGMQSHSLFLNRYNQDWDSYDRFLAVRK